MFLHDGAQMTRHNANAIWQWRRTKSKLAFKLTMYTTHRPMQVLVITFVTTCTNVGFILVYKYGWLGSRVVSVLDSGTEGPGFKSQPRR